MLASENKKNEAIKKDKKKNNFSLDLDAGLASNTPSMKAGYGTGGVSVAG